MITEFGNIFEPGLLEEIAHIAETELGKVVIILKENAFIKGISLALKSNIRVRKTDENGKEIIMYHIESGRVTTTIKASEVWSVLFPF